MNQRPRATESRLVLAGPEDDVLAVVRRRLTQQAFVFEDPATYTAGVEDALAAVAALMAGETADPPEVTAGEAPVVLRGAAG